MRHVFTLAARGRIETAHQLLSPRHCSERETAGQRLAKRAQIRHYAVAFLRSAVGQAEAGDDLVEDQRHTESCRYLAQRFEKTGLRLDYSL